VSYENFGTSVAISSDGTTAVVGVPSLGEVFVYKLVSGTWTQTGKLFSGGSSVAISANGSTIVTGEPGDTNDSGAVFIYSDSSGSWRETASFAGTPYAAADFLGSSVAVNGSGTVAAAVAYRYPGNGSNSAPGAVFVYQHRSTGWKQTATITGTSANGIGSGANDDLGLSRTGSMLVVGNPNSASSGNGSISVFTHASGKWANTATLTAATGTEVGGLVALSADGSTIVTGDQFTGTSTLVFSHSSGSWKQTSEIATAGSSLALSANGSAVLIGEYLGVGEALLYNLSGGKWTKTATLSPSDTHLPGAELGSDVALSGNGLTALAGGPYQTGNGGSPSQCRYDQSPPPSALCGEGAAYVFVS
jgi:hypothetical protein